MYVSMMMKKNNCGNKDGGKRKGINMEEKDGACEHSIDSPHTLQNTIENKKSRS